MSTIDTSRLLNLRATILAQNDALARAAGSGGTAKVSADNAEGFGNTIASALKSVNDQQTKASALSASFESGATTDIVQVMVERQKASLSFEATLQVRNKLLSAYRDIMNLPV
jgi:flagellar hook-basal body complex protein FliE